ncbi:Pol II transcription elongation factor [Trichosporon asahii var. asahii CBS 8904]|uniref:Pol II transcription elongation factor n=1 Tax=Trichosporon asahii var. asahii (strain CBS 8904) TaxID=1220162 RepID=K1VIC9_TRIAC|nr:Pol II transcription elongation factor [Trichosporon asahii var. asahii CBS 8904]
MAEEQPSGGRIHTVAGPGATEVDIDLDTLGEAEVADALTDLLTDYSAECKEWTLFAGEHWRAGRFERAEQVLLSGIKFFGSGGHVDSVALSNLHAMLAHLHLAWARTAPTVVLSQAKSHYSEATAHLNRADEAMRSSGANPDEEPVSLSMGKIILYSARGQQGTAAPLVERLLQRQPDNLPALAAQARLQFARRETGAALVTYQKILALNPNAQPDPRIGIGLCAWTLGDRVRATMAWDRALELDPSSWAARLMLALANLNMAREPNHPMDKRLTYESEGVSHAQNAFKLNNKSTAASLVLSGVAALGGHIELASKLAERAIQYADNKRHVVMSNSERGRLGFVAGDVADAGVYIAAAKGADQQNVNMMAELTLAQIAIKNGNLREALNFVEQTAKRLNGKPPLEFTVLHASLLAYPHLGMPADELARNRVTARDMLSGIQDLVSNADSDEDWAKLRGIAADSDTFVELAKLWQEESVDKAINSYQTAISIKADLEEEDTATQETKPVDYSEIKLKANLAALYALQGHTENAEAMFQDALSKLTKESGPEADAMKTVLAYDLGRAFEQGGDIVNAQKWYRDVLHQHPEHMESKVRLAHLATIAGRNVEAHNYLKECLRADDSNLTLRSVYTNFLIGIGSFKEALNFTSHTLRLDKTDPYTFTALGWLHYTLGREAKSQQDVAERPKQYLRSAEAYERALSLDPTNAVAAQGLAIALAENTLVPKNLQPAPGSAEDVKTRTRLAGNALSVLGRIKDSLPEGPVSVNIGHCYFLRGEEQRAIEAYGSALNSYGGHNVSVLLYLCRAWFTYATKESNVSAMSQALSYATQALHIQPSDRAILYNIGLILQNAATIMLDLEPSKRTLEELTHTLKRAEEAASIFRSLADDKAGPLAYDRNMADQRAKFLDSIVSRGQAEVKKQEAYEAEFAARVEEARRVRAEEQARIEAQAAARQAEIDARAAELAEERRKAREEAAEWHAQLQEQKAADELRKAEAKEAKKRRKEREAEEEGEEGGGRKRRKSKKKRREREQSESEPELEPAPSDGEEDEEAAQERRKRNALAAIKKKRGKGRARREDPDDEEDADTGRGGKKYKSKAIIEDSDEEMDEPTTAPSPPQASSPPANGGGSEDEAEANGRSDAGSDGDDSD